MRATYVVKRALCTLLGATALTSLTILGPSTVLTSAVGVARDLSPICLPTEQNHQCGDDADETVAAAVATIESGGLTCSTIPAGTDTVIFQYRDHHTEIVTFDEASSLTSAGTGLAREYCTGTPR